MKKSIIFIAILVFILCGCDQTTHRGQLTEYEKQGLSVYRFTNSQEPATIDPSKATGVYENRIINMLFEGLVRYGDEGVYAEAGIAESYEIKENGKKYVFSLRKDAKWSDGVPVTAHDFVFAYQRILNPATIAQYGYMLYDLVNAKKLSSGEIDDFNSLGAKALDDYTLELELNQAVPYFYELLTHYTFYPIPRHVIEKHGDKWTEVENLVGNGAFTLKERVMNSQMVFHKNDMYWEKDRVKLDIVIAYTTNDQETQLRMFQSGMVDWLSNPIPRSAYPKVKTNPEWTAPPYLGSYFFCFNTQKKPFNDKRVRKALSMAIDRQIIADKILIGERPAFSYIPKDSAYYTPDYVIKENIEEAKKLLAEAGYPDGKGFPEITILYNTKADETRMCTIIQSMWSTNLNIPVKIENNEWKTYIDRMKKINYDVIRRGWIADYNDAFNFAELFMTGGGNNNTGWSNTEYDALVEQTKIETDKEKRKELFQKAEKILLQESPVMPIYFYVADQMVKPYVRGFYPRIEGDDHGEQDIQSGKFNIADNHPITRIWIDMEAKRKYLGLPPK